MKKVLMLAAVLLGTSAMVNAQQTPAKGGAQTTPAKEVKATKKATKKAVKAEKKAEATATTPAKK